MSKIVTEFKLTDEYCETVVLDLPTTNIFSVLCWVYNQKWYVMDEGVCDLFQNAHDAFGDDPHMVLDYRSYRSYLASKVSCLYIKGGIQGIPLHLFRIFVDLMANNTIEMFKDLDGGEDESAGKLHFEKSDEGIKVVYTPSGDET